jgi:hypothetical protein
MMDHDRVKTFAAIGSDHHGRPDGRIPATKAMSKLVRKLLQLLHLN